MNLRKALFVFGGGGIIVIILAYRFGLLTKLVDYIKQEETTIQTEVTQKTTVKKSTTVETPKVETPVVEEPKATVEPTKARIDVVVEEKVEEKTEVVPPSVAAIGSGDPFNYSANSAGDFTSMTGGKKVNNISIKGIIQMEGKDPIAILHIEDKDETHYVSKGDVIRINTESKNSALITESYIVVKDVRQNEVELIQQERPDKVIIIR